MYDALLNFRFRVAGAYGLGGPGQVVHADDQDVGNTAVSKFIQDTEPELSRFVFADPHAEDIFAAVQIDGRSSGLPRPVRSAGYIILPTNYSGIKLTDLPDRVLLLKMTAVPDRAIEIYTALGKDQQAAKPRPPIFKTSYELFFTFQHIL